MRVLVCGSREWNEPHVVYWVLAGLIEHYEMYVQGLDDPPVTVINGGARGADTAAYKAARKLVDRDRIETYPAKWDKFGKRAGPIRNQRMLDEGKPDVVIAFTDHFISSRGTRDMVQRAKDAGITTYVIGRA